ncbi:zinc finger protein 2-like isoform X2 [Mercenaria mercenaria]|uniref:zinc finger protein 2-like isoform X2 n=1 Tax=Mercenaria mercenaria TaxID=6596 RepID=UPI00234E4237|nr:zinc finger protein 2-like isoform X2 [Mercenaria mercenaria]
MQEKRYGKMDKYLLTIMVTFEQEYAIQKLFGRHGWEYSKITDEISLKDFKSGEKSSPEIQPELNQQSCVKKTVASDSSKIVTSNDDKDSSNTPRHETAIPAVKFSMQNDVNNMLDNSINSEADAYHNDEGDGDDDYGGDTDTEQTLMSLGIVVKEELESGDDDDKASEHDVDSINKRSSNVKPSGKGKRSAQSKAETRNKKKRKQATSTVPSAEVEDNVDKGESEVKLEGLSAEDQGTDDPLAVLETLPDIEHVSKVVSSNTHDVETFLTGPDDVDESGYSVSLSLYFCRDCQYTFPEEKYYTLHKRSGKCVFQCQFCDKKYTFKNFSQYQEHLKQHRSDSSTGKIDNHDENLELSMLEDQSEPNEQEILTSDGSFHEVDVETNRNECAICGKRFQHRKSLKRHLKKHSETAIMCNGCGTSFDSGQKLEDHNKKYHQVGLICDECGTHCSSKQVLQNHKVLKHNADGKNRHACPYPECEKVFVKRTLLEDHINSHLKIKSHSCDKCDKKFISRYDKGKHSQICGMPSRKKICLECGQTFSSYSSLNIHSAAVHQKKCYPCACGKNFKYITGMLKHKKSKNH